jgi:hypothetical protein
MTEFLEKFVSALGVVVTLRKVARGIQVLQKEPHDECVLQLGDKIPKVSLAGTPLKSGDVAFPCGMIAKYFFNDTFVMADDDNKLRV